MTLSYSGSTTTNMTGNNDAATVGLSATDWSVVGNKGSASNYPGLNKAGQIRLYYNASGSNSIVVSSLTGATINSITVTYGTSNYNAIVKVGSSTITDTNNADATGQYAINSSSFTIENGYSSNTQVYILSIVINYTPATPSYTITAQSNNTDYGTVSLSGSVITGSPKSGYRYATPAYSVSPANSATVSQNGNEFTVTPSANTTVTINFEAIPTYAVTLGDNSATLTEESAGAGVTLPSRDALNGYEFAGWSETNVSEETTTAPTIIPAGTYYPSANITLYPVYTKTVAGGGTTHETASVTVSEYATAHNWGSSSSSGQKSITLNSDVTATCNDGTNSGKYYSDWRIYQTETGKVTISTTSGELTSVTFTFTVSNTGTLNYNSSAITSGTAVNVSGTSAEFTVGNSTNATNGQVRITAISVNYDVTGGGTTYYWSAPVAAAVETPSIVVAENPFLFSTTATITCATEGAAIKYSYDNENWSDYSEALTITETKTIYAKATKNENVSTVAQVTVTKNLATPTVTVSGDLTLDLDGETNVSAGTLSAAVTYNEAAVAGATVTWSSSNTDVATIDASGAVTIKTTGSVTFTATYAGNSDYASATGTKTVTVIDNKAPGSAGNPYTVAEAIDAIDNDGNVTDVYVRGIVCTGGSSLSSGALNYWISDDGTETNKFEIYRGKGISNANFTNTDDIQVGDIVVVRGNITLYNSTTYEFSAGSQLVSRTEKPASDLAKTSDIVLDYLNNNTTADVTNYITSSSTGAYTFTVGDGTIIENADEIISALAVGTTTVTVNQAATLSYKAGSVVINVTVQDTRTAATTIPAINISTLTEGAADGTIEVVNPVKADEDVTFSFTSSDEDVLLIIDDAYTVGEVGTATVTVTATPSNTNLYKPVVANFDVTVQAAVMSENEISLAASSGSTVYGTPLNVNYTIADGYDGTMSYTIANSAIADVTIGASAITFTPKAVGTATITISAPATATFNAAENVQYTLTVTAPEGVSTAAVLGEETYTFDLSDNSDWEFPTDYATGENTYTKDGKTITLYAESNGYKHLGSALLIGKSGSTLTLPAFDRPVTKISTTGVTGASGKVTQNIFVGETAVSTVTTSAAVDHEYEIASEYQAAGTIYTLKVTNANNTQLSDITVHMQGGIAVKLNAAGYATYCSQYPLDFSKAEGYTAWQITGVDGTTITFSQITGSVKGGTGILLKGPATEPRTTITLTSVNSSTVLDDNLLEGTLAPTYVADNEYYGLSGNLFKKVNAGTVPAGKALLPASEVSGARELTFFFEDSETTGINSIENGKLTMENGAWYTLGGQKMNGKPATKGIYIINGKKVVIK